MGTSARTTGTDRAAAEHVARRFATRLVELLAESGMTKDELASAVGTSRAAAYHWVKGTVTPRADVLCALADLFGVTTDYLLGRPS